MPVIAIAGFSPASWFMSWMLFFSAEGRLNRAKYWLLTLLALAGTAPTLILLAYGDNFSGVKAASFLLYIAILVSIPVCLTSSIKRLHDRDKHGPYWLALYFFLPAVLETIALSVQKTGTGPGPNFVALAFHLGALSVLAWMFIDLGLLRGTIGPNQYGADPLPSEKTPSARVVHSPASKTR